MRKVLKNKVRVPKQSRSKATVDVIVRAAARIFSKGGFHKTSTRRIAEIAGVSIGTLYEYFPGKRELLAAMAKRHLEDLASKFEAALISTEELSLEEGIESVIETIFASKRIELGLERALLHHSSFIEIWGSIEKWDVRIIELLSQFLKKPGVRAGDIETMSYVLLHAVRSVAVGAAVEGGDRLHDPRFKKEVCLLVLRYLKA